MATQSQPPRSLVSFQPIPVRSVSANPPWAVPGERPQQRGRKESTKESNLYSWDELATAQRQAVLALVRNSRRQRRRVRLRALVVTLLLVLLIVASMAVIVFGIGSPLTFSM